VNYPGLVGRRYIVNSEWRCYMLTLVDCVTDGGGVVYVSLTTGHKVLP
jgi:hypothetical protein